MNEQLISVPVEKFLPPPRNYRRTMNPAKFAELVASVKEHGVLEPVRGRPVKVKGKEEIELVFGERRLRAAKEAKLEAILAVVTELTDAEVLEMQLAENGPREDVAPLEEAAAFQELIEKHGRTVHQIAEKMGRPASHVAQRMKLLALSKECRKALDEDRITLAVATLLAKIPDAKLQAEGLKEVQGTDWDPPAKLDEAKKILEERFLLRLQDAPFDTTSPDLVPKAGACTACPKRTGQQRELFADVKSPDLCTDPPCFRTKLDALWQIRKKEAKASGTELVEGKGASEARSVYSRSAYVALDVEKWDGNKTRKIKDIVSKAKPPTALARGEDGSIFEVVRRADVEKVLNAKKKEGTPARRADDSYQAKQRREERQKKLRRKAITLAITAAVDKAGKLAPIDVLELVVRAFAARCWHEVQIQVLERRGLAGKNTNAEQKIVQLAKNPKTNADTLGLGLELALRSGAPWNGAMVDSVSSTWRDALKLAGVDFAKFEKQVAAEEKAKKGKAPAAKKGGRR